MLKAKQVIFYLSAIMSIIILAGCVGGRTVVTPLANSAYDIYVAGNVIHSDRPKLIHDWEEAASKTCNGNYEVIKPMATGQAPAGSMSIDGQIRCK